MSRSRCSLELVLQGLFHPVRIFSYSFCIIDSDLLANRSTGVSTTHCTWEQKTVITWRRLVEFLYTQLC